jgi:hypothetical protein
MRAISVKRMPRLADRLRSLKIDERVWRGVSVLLTLVGIGVVGWQLSHFGFSQLFSLLPANAAFYFALIMLYLTLPLSEWIIFNRLWGVPVAAIAPLLRKAIINDVVLNYGGELYLYTWAKERGAVLTAGQPRKPFGAIKDVSILSAIAANLFTLGLMVAAVPFIDGIIPSGALLPAIGSGLILVLIPLMISLFAQRIFSLTKRQLRFVAAMHFVRLFLSLVLGIVICALALPEIPVMVWVLLQTLRLLVSRLPLIPNKDLLFASVLTLLAGHGSAVAALISMTAMAVLALHFLVFIVLLALDVAATFQRASAPRFRF